MPVATGDTHTFKHAWGDISLASWKKYPSTERKDVVQLDLLERRFSPATGILETTRLCQARAGTPAWFNMIFGTPEYVYFVEHATIDPRAGRMTLVSRNVTWAALLQMTETCVYTPAPSAPHSGAPRDWTHLAQNATVRSTTWGVARKIEEYCAARYARNAAVGRGVMEAAIARIHSEAADGLVLVEAMRRRLADGIDELAEAVDDIGDKIDRIGTAVAVGPTHAQADDKTAGAAAAATSEEDSSNASASVTGSAPTEAKERAQTQEAYMAAALAVRRGSVLDAASRTRR